MFKAASGDPSQRDYSSRSKKIACGILVVGAGVDIVVGVGWTNKWHPSPSEQLDWNKVK